MIFSDIGFWSWGSNKLTLKFNHYPTYETWVVHNCKPGGHGFESHWGSKTSLYFSPKREVWNDSQTFSNTSFQFNLNTFGQGYFYLDKKSLGKSCCSWHGFGYLCSLEASGQWQIQDPTGCCLTSCWPSEIECLQGVHNVFIELDYDCFELDGFDQQFKPLSTTLISAVDKSQLHQEWKNSNECRELSTGQLGKMRLRYLWAMFETISL